MEATSLNDPDYSIHSKHRAKRPRLDVGSTDSNHLEQKDLKNSRSPSEDEPEDTPSFVVRVSPVTKKWGLKRSRARGVFYGQIPYLSKDIDIETQKNQSGDSELSQYDPNDDSDDVYQPPARQENPENTVRQSSANRSRNSSSNGSSAGSEKKSSDSSSDSKDGSKSVPGGDSGGSSDDDSDNSSGNTSDDQSEDSSGVSSDDSSDDDSEDSSGTDREIFLESGSNSDAQDSSEDDEIAPRPRYEGGTKGYGRFKYFQFTKAEVNALDSVTNQRNEDLAFHLYAIHHSKRLARRKFAKSLPKNRDPKMSWISKRKLKAGQGFVSRAWWTAWPLKPDRVPREWENWSERKMGSQYEAPPGYWLRETLTGHIQKTARYRFEAQKKREDIIEATAVDEPQSEQSSRAHRLPTKHRQTILDDSQSGAVIRPHLNSALSKLDEVLLALHDSQKAKVLSRGYNNRWRRPRDRVSDNRHRFLPNRLPGPHSVRQPRKPKAEIKSEFSAQDPDPLEDDEPTDTANHPPKERVPSKQFRTFGQRDWSAVLGHAAHSGVSPAVLDRARKRCEALFDEKMTFNTVFVDGSNVEGIHLGAEVPKDDGKEYLNGIRRDGFLQPIPFPSWRNYSAGIF